MQKADLIVYNANIYTVDDDFSKATGLAISNGKILATGTSEEILNKFTAENKIDAKGKTLLPGWIDAHCHFYGLGLQQQKVNLVGTKSYKEVLERIQAFQDENNVAYITGRGWDQNDWKDKNYPNKANLDSLFPNTPVAVRRIDGHALLANQAALDLANIDIHTAFSGGEILQENGQLTGILIDNPTELVLKTIPKPDLNTKIKALKRAEKICLSHGLTTVTDAGLDKEIIELIDSLQEAGELQIRVNAMISMNPENLEHYLNNGPIEKDRLHVCSFKVYADGALGSRGACLKDPYADKAHHRGTLLSSEQEFKEIAKSLAKSPFQMNTHAIGDSANKTILGIYNEALNGQKNRRWRVEHAQVVDPKDYSLFKPEIIPSVQPTHATSDMYWAEDRLGAQRIQSAYAYKDLLQLNGLIALGTDFPIEKVDPRLTFYAAIARKDLANYPENGFQKENALSREETLKGMTIWAAYSNFEETIKGSLEEGKVADFILLDADIMQVDETKIPTVNVLDTYIGGKKVF